MRARGGVPGRKRTVSVLACVLGTAACAFGTNLRTSDVATKPVGVTMRVDWRGENTGFWESEAELVLVADSGLYLLHPPNLVFYPFGSPARLRPRGTPGAPRVDLAEPDSAALISLARYARHPFGLDERQLQQLIEALGRSEAIVRRIP
jgi:hypothetical protein